MNGDATLLAWSLFVVTAVLLTAQLWRHLGVLVVSHGAIVSCASLAYYHTNKLLDAPIAAAMIALITGAVLGYLHVPVVKQTNRTVLLIMTLVAHIVVVQAWYALPEVTGGSSGITSIQPLASNSSIFYSVSGLSLLVLAYFAVIAGPTLRVDRELLRELGPDAGVFGIRGEAYYSLAFSVFGLGLGALGWLSVRWLGYIDITSFGLGWSLAILVIALIPFGRPFFVLPLSAVGYACTRGLLTLLPVSHWSSLFDAVFPALLLVGLTLYARRSGRHYSTSVA